MVREGSEGEDEFRAFRHADTRMERMKRYMEVIREGERTLNEFFKSRGGVLLPVPILEVAAWLGFRVIQLYTVPDEFSAIVSPAEHLIGVNGNHHPHRRRFSVAHELAHIVLRHPPESRCTPRQIRLLNAEADTCAAELLIPAQLLVVRLARRPSLPDLSRVFDVSQDALTVKIRTLSRS
jgi:hypothetical protein